MRIGLIGCVQSSEMALKTLLSIPEVNVCAVVTREASRVNNDFCDLSEICDLESIPCHYENLKEKEQTAKFLKKYDLDVIYCIGWSYLLDESIISIPQKGVIGFHPAKLPKNRGRHPIIWALALGLEETASTFFKIDQGVDSGPILSQEIIQIAQSDDASALYKKVMSAAKLQIEKFTPALANGTAEFAEQDDSEATYWRKRSRKDGLIDFRMSAQVIYDLVRALAPPYPCAEIRVGEAVYQVSKSEALHTGFEKNIEPGKVLEVDGADILVKTGGNGAIRLLNVYRHNIEAGDYLL